MQKAQPDANCDVKGSIGVVVRDAEATVEALADMAINERLKCADLRLELQRSRAVRGTFRRKK